jgi:hypothetical protein
LVVALVLLIEQHMINDALRSECTANRSLEPAPTADPALSPTRETDPD